MSNLGSPWQGRPASRVLPRGQLLRQGWALPAPDAPRFGVRHHCRIPARVPAHPALRRKVGQVPPQRWREVLGFESGPRHRPTRSSSALDPWVLGVGADKSHRPRLELPANALQTYRTSPGITWRHQTAWRSWLPWTRQHQIPPDHTRHHDGPRTSRPVGGRKSPGGFDSRPPPLRKNCPDLRRRAARGTGGVNSPSRTALSSRGLEFVPSLPSLRARLMPPHEEEAQRHAWG